MMRRPFAAHPDGVRMRLGAADVGFLSQIPEMLEGVGSVQGDPASERLSVPAYLDDADANQEFWHWMQPELDASRTADRSAFLELVRAAEEGTVASPAEAEAFLRVLVEARLALAARLKIDVEDDYSRLGPDEASALEYLGALQVLLIQALSRR